MPVVDDVVPRGHEVLDVEDGGEVAPRARGRGQPESEPLANVIRAELELVADGSGGSARAHRGRHADVELRRPGEPRRERDAHDQGGRDRAEERGVRHPQLECLRPLAHRDRGGGRADAVERPGEVRASQPTFADSVLGRRAGGE